MRERTSSDLHRTASKTEMETRELTIVELNEVTGGLIAFPSPMGHLPTTTGPTYPR